MQTSTAVLFLCLFLFGKKCRLFSRVCPSLTSPRSCQSRSLFTYSGHLCQPQEGLLNMAPQGGLCS